MDKSIIFMGTPEFAAHILDRLIKEGFNIVCVVTQPDKPFGRKKILKQSEVKEVALKNNNSYMSEFKVKQISSSSSNYKITNKFIEKYSKNISEYDDKIAALVLKYYNMFIAKFIQLNSENIDTNALTGLTL